MSTTEWRDELYRKVFEDVYAILSERKRRDPGFAVEDAQGVLKHLYVNEGNDWQGRGGREDESLSAQIAAHEAFIREWEVELSNKP
jgi:hypothetical protein